MIEITLNQYLRFVGFVPTSHGREALFEDGDEDMIRFPKDQNLNARGESI